MGRLPLITAALLAAGVSTANAQNDACTNPASPGYSHMHASPVLRSICDEERQRQEHAEQAQQQWRTQQDASIEAHRAAAFA